MECAPFLHLAELKHCDLDSATFLIFGREERKETVNEKRMRSLPRGIILTESNLFATC